MKKFVILPLVLAGLIFAGNLMINGDFEQDLSIGWQQLTSGANITINRGTSYDNDPDYEAYVYKGTGGGFAKLFQTIDIPSTDLDFFVNAKLYAYDNHASAWTGAAIMLCYIDESDNVLGSTRICARSTQCPWTNSATLHIIPAPDSFWHSYAFNIDDELANLSGVNPLEVRKIQIALYDSTYHC